MKPTSNTNDAYVSTESPSIIEPPEWNVEMGEYDRLLSILQYGMSHTSCLINRPNDRSRQSTFDRLSMIHDYKDMLPSTHASHDSFSSLSAALSTDQLRSQADSTSAENAQGAAASPASRDAQYFSLSNGSVLAGPAPPPLPFNKSTRRAFPRTSLN